MDRLVAIAPLPPWASRCPQLAEAGYYPVPTRAELRMELDAAFGSGERPGSGPELGTESPVDPAELAPHVAGACFDSGVGLGCCGALANDLVIERAAAELAACLRWVRV